MVKIVGVRALVPPHHNLGSELITPPEPTKMSARAILQCRPNSHPFPERNLNLDQPVKIGRSVARAKPGSNNAIFDCKVLSRNQALLWYENGKFYLKDTKSSNGTFVNNQRLSVNAEESPPREVCSGDIVQFGVDVMENSRKLTHVCIVATLKLYMPDGQEAKASPSTAVGSTSFNVSANELYEIKTYLQEATYREQQIETKLASVQHIIISTQEAAVHSWNAMIDEDRLLQRLETLEAQLATYAKNYPEENIREEMRRLLEEKGQFEVSVKESLRVVLQEKLDAITKLSQVERSLSTTEDELQHVKDVADSAQTELTELMGKQTTQMMEISELNGKLKLAEENLKEASEQFEEEKRELELQLKEKTNLENTLLVKIECLNADNDFTKGQLSAIKAKYENFKNGELSGSKIIDTEQKDSDFVNYEALEARRTLETTQAEIKYLRERLRTAQEELQQAESNVTRLKQELLELRCKNAVGCNLVEHLRSQIAIMETRLKEYQMNSDKIVLYEDLYDSDNTHTLIRTKKDPNKENNKKEKEELEKEKECEEKDDSIDNESEVNTTLVDEVMDKNTVNGTTDTIKHIEDDIDDAKLIILQEDISRLKELLEKSESSKLEADKEVERVRQELQLATTAVVTASHEASNLKQQLAASEATMGEKAKYVSTLQDQVIRMEDCSEETRTNLTSLSLQLSQEKAKAAAAELLADRLKKQLEEAENLAEKNVTEIESLSHNISQLERRQAELQTTSTLIVPPNPDPPPEDKDNDQKDITDGAVSSQDSTDTESQNSTADNQKQIETDCSSKAVSWCPKCQGHGFSNNEQEVTQLRARLAQLEGELAKWQHEVAELQKKEANVRSQIQLESTTSTMCNSPADSTQSSPQHTPLNLQEILPQKEDVEPLKEVETLKEALVTLQKQHELLKEQLAHSDEHFHDLSLQNRTTIPTWVMVLLVIAVALGSEWAPNFF